MLNKQNIPYFSLREMGHFWVSSPKGALSAPLAPPPPHPTPIQVWFFCWIFFGLASSIHFWCQYYKVYRRGMCISELPCSCLSETALSTALDVVHIVSYNTNTSTFTCQHTCSHTITLFSKRHSQSKFPPFYQCLSINIWQGEVAPQTVKSAVSNSVQNFYMRKFHRRCKFLSAHRCWCWKTYSITAMSSVISYFKERHVHDIQ